MDRDIDVMDNLNSHQGVITSGPYCWIIQISSKMNGHPMFLQRCVQTIGSYTSSRLSSTLKTANNALFALQPVGLDSNITARTLRESTASFDG